jgi:hypothetical protein
MNMEDRKAKPGDVTMRMLAPSLHNERVLLSEMIGTLDASRMRPPRCS